mmetsp:Transcript_26422/g.55787  ORF Transcript_26422/g.55787 Transcript_26422/m.55787 type:complete len:542 (-) Transcript_26422:97-1722(-)
MLPPKYLPFYARAFNFQRSNAGHHSTTRTMKYRYRSNTLFLIGIGSLSTFIFLVKEAFYDDDDPLTSAWDRPHRRLQVECHGMETWRHQRPAPGLMSEPVGAAFAASAPGGATLSGTEPLMATSSDSVSVATDSESESDKTLSIAIGRPFAVHQIDELVASFDEWKTFPLSRHGCKNFEIGSSSNRIGLVLSFPREGDPHRYPEVYEAYKKIQEMWRETNGWGGCISSVDLMFANIDKEYDIYANFFDKEEGYYNWVNGPNRQFERLFRFIQKTKKFDVWYLMEPDSHPRRDFWLDHLLEEVREKQPFAMLGSKYNGKRWDRWGKHMPLSVLHHINGNAVYNLTDPLLLNMVSEFESEHNTIFNAIPFDLRLSQMVLEGASGEPSPFVFNRNTFHRDLPNKTGKFIRWWRDYVRHHDSPKYAPMKESRIMSNMGLDGDGECRVDKYSIVHGQVSGELLSSNTRVLKAGWGKASTEKPIYFKGTGAHAVTGTVRVDISTLRNSATSRAIISRGIYKAQVPFFAHYEGDEIPEGDEEEEFQFG